MCSLYSPVNRSLSRSCRFYFCLWHQVGVYLGKILFSVGFSRHHFLVWLIHMHVSIWADYWNLSSLYIFGDCSDSIVGRAFPLGLYMADSSLIPLTVWSWEPTSSDCYRWVQSEKPGVNWVWGAPPPNKQASKAFILIVLLEKPYIIKKNWVVHLLMGYGNPHFCYGSFLFPLCT